MGLIVHQQKYRNIARIISSGTNSCQCFDTSTGGLLVPEDIIRPMVDTSAGGLLVPEDWYLANQQRYRNIGRIISSETNSPPAEVSTIGRIISSGTNSLSAEVSKHWADNILRWTVSPRGYYQPNGRYLCW
jgi:hypothetical protein